MSGAVLQPGLSGLRPRTPPSRLPDLCQQAWGINGDLTPLPAVADELFRLDSNDGRRFVLRLSSPFEDPLATDFQTRALAHLGDADPALPIPRLIPTREGALIFRPDWEGEPTPAARLFTWLEGVPLVEAKYPDGAAMGQMLARLGLGLADFDHPGADHHHDWDLRHAGKLAPLVEALTDSGRRAIAGRAMARFLDQIAPSLECRRRQVVHNDFNLHNVLIAPGHPDRITGVIDFGDMVRTALIADVAIAACYVLGSEEDPLAIIRPLVAAYHEARPLTQEEILLLPGLMEARHLMTVAITEWRAAENPRDRASITKNTARAWRGLELLGSVSHQHLGEELLNACQVRGVQNG